MNVLIIDGQGGRLGQLLVEEILSQKLSVDLLVIGTNSAATSAMMKAGAPKGATGENPVLVNSGKADVIIGPIGIIAADSLLGEITPAMAARISQSNAVKLLLPVNHCNHLVIGVAPMTMNELVKATVERLKTLL